MKTVYEQLYDYCDCVRELIGDDGVSDPTFIKYVDEMIHLISLKTCWINDPCETLLNSERIEIIQVDPFNKCCCDAGIIKFTPYYTPFNADSVSIELIEISGIHETITEIDPNDYAYSTSCKQILIDVTDYVNFDLCNCQSIWKLRIKYDAGYIEIPECLLQLFCDILHVIYDKNNCNCEKCQACTGNNTYNDVVIEYAEGDTISPKIDQYLNILVLNMYNEQLGLLSLCDRCSGIWAVVV